MFGTLGIGMQDKEGNIVELDTKVMLDLALFLSRREQQELKKKSDELSVTHGENFVAKSFDKAAKSQEMVTDMIDYISKNPYRVTPAVLNVAFLLRAAASEDIKNANAFLKHNNL